MTYREVLTTAVHTLKEHGIEDADFDALQMMLPVAKDAPEKYPLFLSLEMPPKARQRYLALIERRCAREPLQYILGEWDFLDSVFKVGPGVLIPRPETEELTLLSSLMINAKGFTRVYDLCAGSGCIGISIAKACEQTEVWCFEKYDEAFHYLLSNIPESLRDRVHPVKSDIFDGCPASIPAPDFIVSNPPYVENTFTVHWQKELDFEPRTALVGGEDGLDFYRAIAKHWIPLLPNGGMCGVELGEEQAQPVMALFRSNGVAFSRKDVNGIDRFVFLDKNSKQ